MDPRVNQKLIVGICFLLIILVGIFTYGYFSKSDEKTETLRHVETYSLNVYKNMEGVLCLNKSEDCKESVMNISVENEYAKLIDMTEDGNYILLDDNGIKLYDVKNDTKKNINLDGFDTYKIGYDFDKNKVVGILYYKDKYVDEVNNVEDYKIKGFYNFQENKKMYEGIYENLVVLNDKYLEGKIVKDKSEENYNIETSLLLIDEEKQVNIVNGMCEEYSLIKTDKSYYIREKSGCIDLSNSTLYTDDLSLLAESLEDSKWSVEQDGYLYILNENRVNKYNAEGVVIGTSKEYQQIEQIIKDYIVYVENGVLKITNENDVDLDIASWNPWSSTYDGATSGYRGVEEGYPQDKSGIYINVYNNDELLSYRFSEETKEIFLIENNE